MTVYFDNCLGSCTNATMEQPEDTPVSRLIDLCRERWGDGSLMRTGPNREWTWVKMSDRGEAWIGCCAEKMKGATP